MKLLIDADTPCYAAAAVHEADDVEYAIMEANQSIQRLLNDTEATSFDVFLTGENNFRYNIFPEYKANRLKTPRPRHLQAVKEAVARGWNAIISHGCEADDLLGIEQMKWLRFGAKDSCIASIDKDLDQIPGEHYHPGIKRKDVWIREPKLYTITPESALYFFYYQLLIGDTSDNIKGAIGIGPKKAENILTGCETDWDYYQAVVPFFSCEEELIQNARCVKIWTSEEERENLWTPPLEPGTETQLCGERIKNRDTPLASQV